MQYVCLTKCYRIRILLHFVNFVCLLESFKKMTQSFELVRHQLNWLVHISLHTTSFAFFQIICLCGGTIHEYYLNREKPDIVLSPHFNSISHIGTNFHSPFNFPSIKWFLCDKFVVSVVSLFCMVNNVSFFSFRSSTKLRVHVYISLFFFVVASPL